MVRQLNVEGYRAVKEAVNENLKLSEHLFILFCGSKDANGTSWCPDCVAAEPVVEEALKNVPEDATFIHCSVGNRTYWKDPMNEFRSDEKFKLKCIPTLIKYNTAQRLEEEQCQDATLVSMIFED